MQSKLSERVGQLPSARKHNDDDLYKTLGVGKRAKRETILRQYRAMSKQVHPDTHPSDPTAVDKFKALTEAFEVLNDPAKRATYDKTGKIPPKVADSERQAAHAVISETMHKIIQQSLQFGADPSEKELVETMRGAIEQQIAAIEKNIADSDKARAMLADVADRFTVDDGQANLCASIARAPLVQIETALAALRDKMAAHKAAHDYLRAYKFRRKESKVRTATSTGNGLFVTFSSS